MTSKKILVVIGATGNQGTSVIDSFLPAASEWHVRAVTRNPYSAKALSLAAVGCEVVRADTGDVGSLVTAFEGATAIFAMTDYWAPFWDEGVRSRLTSGQSIRKYCHDEEIRHGTNMATAAASTEALRSGTLSHYIWSCTSSPTKWSKGKYSKIHHFESKAMVTDWIRANEPELAKRMSAIHVSFYASNVYTFQSMRPQKKPDGTFTIERLTPIDKKHPFIATRWDTGQFVKALVERPPGKTLLAYTAMVSFGQMVDMWSRATGEKATYRQCTLKQLAEEFPEEGEEGAMSDMYSNDFGYSGGDPDCLVPADLGINDRPDVVERWLAQADWDAVMDKGWRTVGKSMV